MDSKRAKQFFKFFHLVENAKKVTRHCWTSRPRRRESVAEHCYRMCLMTMVLVTEFGKKLDLEKLLKIILIHDLPEAITGDIPCFMQTPEIKKKKDKEELEAMLKFKNMLPEKNGKEIFDLYKEYKERKTLEAKIAKMLDGQDVKLSHLEEGVSNWDPREAGWYTINAGDQHLDFPEAEKIRPLVELIRQKLINEHKKNKLEIK